MGVVLDGGGRKRSKEDGQPSPHPYVGARRLKYKGRSRQGGEVL